MCDMGQLNYDIKSAVPKAGIKGRDKNVYATLSRDLQGFWRYEEKLYIERWNSRPLLLI